jgi:ribonucleoside-diphosphate reductase alpha chain
MVVDGTDKTYGDLKRANFDFACPLDMTNISVNYDTEWLMNYNNTGDVGNTFRENVRHALTHGEPGFSFNFFDKENETLRNACTEVTSEDDSDVCNLGSVNLSRINSLAELHDVVELATKFLLLGTLHADLPYDKVKKVREKNRRLGLGVMGIHEWLLQRGYRYEVVPELHRWLSVYRGCSDSVSRTFSSKLGISTPVANRAIAPTGTIGMLAGTTTGIEPLYAVAYKRRYIVHSKSGPRYKYQYAVDHIAQNLINEYSLDPNEIESAIDLAQDYERRIKFQAEVQDYVDMGISSTINLPNLLDNLSDRGQSESKSLRSNETRRIDVESFSNILASYASRLRGFTCYPDGARGGQPLQSVEYSTAVNKLGEEFDEHVEVNDVCDITGGGYCGS